MSHVDNISTNGEEFDLEVIQELCRRMGWTFVEGKKTYAWYGYSVGDYPIPEGFTEADLGKCDHAIQIPGCSYEVGLVQGVDGGYNVIADFWREGGLDQVLGKHGELFQRDYNWQKDVMAAEEKGYDWQEVEIKAEDKLPEGARKVVYTQSGDSWGGGDW